MSDGMTPPRDRQTDPAPEESLKEMLMNISTQLGEVAAVVQRIEANGPATARLLKDHGERIEDHEERIAALERFIRNSSAPPAGLEIP